MTHEQSPAPEGVGAVDVAAFLCELAMLALLAVAGWHLGRTTAVSILLAVVAPALAIAVWARWMARTSRSRLPRRVRLAAEIVLFVVTGMLAALAGLLWWGVAFAVVAVAVFALASHA